MLIVNYFSYYQGRSSLVVPETEISIFFFPLWFRDAIYSGNRPAAHSQCWCENNLHSFHLTWLFGAEGYTFVLLSTGVLLAAHPQHSLPSFLHSFSYPLSPLVKRYSSSCGRQLLKGSISPGKSLNGVWSAWEDYLKESGPAQRPSNLGSSVLPHWEESNLGLLKLDKRRKIHTNKVNTMEVKNTINTQKYTSNSSSSIPEK